MIGHPMFIMVAAAPAGGLQDFLGGPSGMFVPLIGMMVIFYFLVMRPQQKRAKEHQAMLAKLGVGDEVVTGGGIVGKIHEISDTFVTLEVADNVRIKVQRGQVTSLVPKGTYKSA